MNTIHADRKILRLLSNAVTVVILLIIKIIKPIFRQLFRSELEFYTYLSRNNVFDRENLKSQLGV